MSEFLAPLLCICFVVIVFYFYKNPRFLIDHMQITAPHPVQTTEPYSNRNVPNELFHGKWMIRFQFENGLPDGCIGPDRDESASENIRRILEVFAVDKGGFLTLSNEEGEEFLQTIRSEKESAHLLYRVEYRPPDKEILYGSEEDLSFDETLSLFRKFLNDESGISTAIKWKDTGFL